MLKIKTLYLENYCGYKEATFDFTNPEGNINPISIFYGPNGCGKCLTGSTFVNLGSSGGQTSIKELFYGLNLKPDTWYNKKVSIDVNGKTEQVNKIYYNGNFETVKITTSCGYFIEGSRDLHSILSVTEDGNLEFVRLSDLKIGDKVAISKKSIFPESCKGNSNIAAILGYMIAEGSCGNKNSGFRFHNKDKEVLEDFVSRCKLEFGYSYRPRYYSYSKDNATIYIKQKHSKILEKYGLNRSLSGEKTVPSSVLQGSKSIIKSFLQAYFEGDGYSSGQIVGCDSKSYQLLHEIQLLLLRLGIVSSLREKRVEKLSYADKGYTSWSISISGENISYFIHEVGFISSRKKLKLEKIICDLSLKNNNPNKDIIPVELWKPISNRIKDFMIKNEIRFSRKDYKNSNNGLHCLQPSYVNLVKNGVSREKIESCILTINKRCRTEISRGNCLVAASELEISDLAEWWDDEYFFDTVSTIEYSKEDLFDLSVEDAHCYWSNGFISHNSTCLNAINFLGNAKQFIGRPNDLVFRKMTFHPDYDPSLPHFTLYNKPMRIEGTFDLDDKELKVIVTSEGETNVLRNDLDGFSNIVYIDADHPMNMKKFQLPVDRVDTFLDIAKTVYGYPVEASKPVQSSEREWDGREETYKLFTSGDSAHTGEAYDYYLDLVIDKGDAKVHFKSMSDGERKIATLLRNLCDPVMIDRSDIVLIDNIEMHVYFKRHAKMIDKLLQCFPTKQFIVTTHSGILIQHVGESWGESYLFDVPEIKGQPLVE